MNSTVGKRLLLIVALAHLLMDAGFAGAAVLCIGPDDHRAVEAEHAVDVACASAPATPAAAGGDSLFQAIDPLAGHCSDSPLHSEAEFVSTQRLDVEAPGGETVTSWGSQVHLSRVPIAGAPARAPDETAALRSLRTTVLLI